MMGAVVESELVPIGGGRRLAVRLRRVGGGPIVVFESGAGMASFTWALVEEALGDDVTTLAYDRAGLGSSDRGPEPRTAAAVATDLDALLRALSLPPPYVLVGHSLAGLYVRAYHAAHPHDVAGIVFVDAVDERVHAELRSRTPRHQRLLQSAQLRVGPIADRLGIAAAFIRRGGPHPAIAARPDLVAQQAAFWRGRNRIRGLLAEGAAITASAAHVATLPDLGDLPLVVVHAGDLQGMFARYAEEWLDAQAGLAALSTRSITMSADGAGHLVPLDRPDVVADAISAVIARAR